jgi:hypothetical protein
MLFKLGMVHEIGAPRFKKISSASISQLYLHKYGVFHAGVFEDQSTICRSSSAVGDFAGRFHHSAQKQIVASTAGY